MSVTIHRFETASEAYDASQTRDEIHDGDVLVSISEGIVGILVEAWPAAITDERGCFHRLEEGRDWTTFDDGFYAESFRIASAEAVRIARFFDGPSFEDLFPRGSHVNVLWPHSSKVLTSGVVRDYTTGLYDFGTPESGPGPLEETELVVVHCDNGERRNVYPGDLEVVATEEV
jgi:hypothetical protein